MLNLAINDVKKLKKLSDYDLNIDTFITQDDPKNYYTVLTSLYKSYVNDGIFLTERKTDKKKFVMKVTFEKKHEVKDVAKLKSEVFNLMSIDSPYVLKPSEIYNFEDKLIIVSEEMDHGSLDRVIKSYHKYYSEEFCKYTALYIARGIFDLHALDIIHRDLKSDNVLGNSFGKIMLTDLG